MDPKGHLLTMALEEGLCIRNSEGPHKTSDEQGTRGRDA